MKSDMDKNQQLSCLLDGELDAAQAQDLVQVCASDRQLMDAWASYCLIGDALRESRHLTSSDQHLQTSPVAAPAIAANDSIFRWKLAAGIAGIAAAGVLGWSAIGSDGSDQDRWPLAQAPSVASVILVQGSAAGMPLGDESAIMVRDPRLDELLAAHRQFGSASALQQPVGILRASVPTLTTHHGY